MRTPLLLGAAAAALVVGGCMDLSTQPGRLQCAPITSQQAEVRGDTVVTTTGLRYVQLRTGGGSEAASCRRVIVQYRGELVDGTVFDPGTQPLDFVLGAPLERMIAGFEEGIVGMQVGERRRLIVPPNLGYGQQERTGTVTIPANSTLIFTVELTQVTVFQ
jgi:peptidylprolyl isomerase